MNFPNLLSAIRIIIALIAPFFLIDSSMIVRFVVGAVCFAAVASDYLDGWYARKYKQVTTLGKILDPIADKALVLICFAVFVHQDIISFWWAIPIFIREIGVTIYRFIFLSKNIVIAAAKSGKLKTVLQMITLGIAYLLFMVKNHFRDYVFDMHKYVLWFALGITLYLTIKSGYLFFKNNWHLIKRYHKLA